MKRFLQYFPLHVIILLWFQLKRSEPVSVMDYRSNLILSKHMLEELIVSVERSPKSLLGKFLLDRLEAERRLLEKMLELGVFQAGWILKK